MKGSVSRGEGGHRGLVGLAIQSVQSTMLYCVFYVLFVVSTLWCNNDLVISMMPFSLLSGGTTTTKFNFQLMSERSGLSKWFGVKSSNEIK